MDRVGCGKRGRLLTVGVLLLVMGLATLMVGACGGDDTTSIVETTQAASSGSSEAASGATGGAGVALAEEILATFDEIVTKAADLAKDSPEPAVLKPQLEELYDSYMPTMTELNGQYLALRDADIAEFGQCNTYLGENRGKHVTAKDNTLSEAVKHYNFDLGDQETVDLLSKRPVELLDGAVAQN